MYSIEKMNFICKKVRRDILLQIFNSGSGHVGGSLSIVELIVTLYKNFMNVDPKNPKMENRDRLIVSKGHCGPAVYAMLSQLGFFPKDWLLTLNKEHTNLPSHCDMNKTPGIDMTTGSLGQGLSCAVGIAIGMNLNKYNCYTYTILGDGELQEGQIWEAAMYASFCKLNNLIAFIDYNGYQIDGSVSEVCEIEPLEDKWNSFGWNTIYVENGNCFKKIFDSIIKAKEEKNRPSVLILKTIKGFGVDFAVKAGVSNHSMSLTEQMLKKAFDEDLFYEDDIKNEY